MQHEADNRKDGEIHKFCKEYVDKKHNIGTLQDLEVVDLCDTNNNNLAISNEKHDMLHHNSNEINITIYNE